METIAVLDSGGQYAHLIARKVRELGVYAEIVPVGIPIVELERYSGLILSGGPSSVFDEQSPKPEPGLFEIGKPMLGICYGHQLIAQGLGGLVERGQTHEFGSATLHIQSTAGLFDGLPLHNRVWMSHGDQVVRLPLGFKILGETDNCQIAAMGDVERGIYGLQFHPEVIHTPQGAEILGNFLRNACHCSMDWHPRDRIASIQASISEQVQGRKVLFFLSGGVDSTVAYALTVKALDAASVEAVYVDTGFMRHGETAEIEEAFSSLGLGRLNVVDASEQFFNSLQGIMDPERKRMIIGQAFVNVQDRILENGHFEGHEWMLGQGTIYPDTIESGGTQSAAVIKTHHNRVDSIQALMDAGLVLEPLTEFYKDEVREIGIGLGLPDRLLNRHPFPGPGLAIRCLCSDNDQQADQHEGIVSFARRSGYKAFLLPLRSVGVQGDSRSYAKVTVLHGGEFNLGQVLTLATELTNAFRSTNRIVLSLEPEELEMSEWAIKRSSLTRERIGLLQAADSQVTDFLHESGLYGEIWQCPVVLLPWSRTGGETIVIRPVTSVDGMTAAVAELPVDGLKVLTARLKSITGIDAVFYDISHKPPSTIEWE